jgi:hypothetical protein
VIGRDGLRSPPRTIIPGAAAAGPSGEPGLTEADKEAALGLFVAGRTAIQKEVPAWATGGAAVIVLANGVVAKTAIFESRQPAETKTAGHFFFLDGDSGTLAIVGRRFHEGKIDCGPGSPEIIIGLSMGKGFSGSAPETLWSDNPGAKCELTLAKGPRAGSFVGAIMATLVANDAKQRWGIVTGYTQLNAVPLAPVGQAGATAPPPAKGASAPAAAPAAPSTPKLRLPR